MRLPSNLAAFIVGGVSCLPAAFAWGAAGHEIVATIAQMYLHPTVLPTVCDILNQTDCHLASFSTWADKNRFRMKWSAPLHYVGAVDDYPPNDCAYPGPNGWKEAKNANVLDAIKNVTGLLEDWVNHDANDATANEALKFLLHFIGDMHQPMHLTSRDRGGNSAKVVWDNRQTNLHSLWDGLLIAKAVRTVPPRYSRPLPYPEIESAFRGAIYDSYIRRILWEGTLNKWEEEIDDWLSCPSTPEFSLVEAESTWQKVFSYFNTPSKKGVEISPDGDFVCPYFWSQPLSALNCDIAWPKELALQEFEEDELSMQKTKGTLELDTPEYAGVIEKRMLLEKLLAQAGIRLAGVLNYLFADQESAKGLFVMNLKM